MPASKAERFRVLDRRKRVAEAYLHGTPQYQIAAKEGVDPAQISRDLAAIRREWLGSAMRDFDTAKAQELAKIDELERTFWEAWQRSCQPREITTSEMTEGGSGGRTQSRGKRKAGVRKEARDGNHEFLKGVERCIERRCAILGLDAPREIRHGGSKGAPPIQLQSIDAELTDEQLASEIADLQREVADLTAKAAATASPPVLPGLAEALPESPLPTG